MRTPFIFLITLILFSCNLLSNDPTAFETTISPGIFNEFKVVFQTEDGGYIVAGTITNTDDPNYRILPTDAFIAKLNDRGNVIKKTILNFSANDAIAKGIKLVDGNIMLLGSTTNSEGYTNVLAVFVNADADTIRTMSFDKQLDLKLEKLVEDNDKNVLLLANQKTEQANMLDPSSFVVYKISASGKLLNEASYTVSPGSYIYEMALAGSDDLLFYGKTKDSLSKDMSVRYLLTGDTLTPYTQNPIGERYIQHLLAVANGTAHIMTEPIVDDKLSMWHVSASDTLNRNIAYNQRTDLISLKQYNSELYLLGLMTTQTASKYYQYKLELRSITNDSLVWSTNRPLADATVMMYDVIVTADSGFAVVGMQDIIRKGSEAFMHKLPKPDIFGTNEAF